MKRFLRFAGVYIAFLLQTIIFENIKIFSCSPDLLLAVIILASVSCDVTESAIIGAFAGILCDIMIGRIPGMYLLLYMYTAIAVSYTVDKKTENSPLICAWTGFVYTTAYVIIVSVLLAFLHKFPGFAHIGAEVFVKGIFSAVTAFIFVALRFGVTEKRKTKASGEAESV